jgi:DNA-directed RNA polymerase subunit F
MDTDNKIKQLYIDFDKSLTTLYTLYDQLPPITFLQTLTINPAQIMITKCDAEIIKHVILLKDTSSTTEQKIINLATESQEHYEKNVSLTKGKKGTKIPDIIPKTADELKLIYKNSVRVPLGLSKIVLIAKLLGSKLTVGLARKEQYFNDIIRLAKEKYNLDYNLEPL